jgi:hypothetical protein
MDIRKINLEDNPLKGATDEELEGVNDNLEKLGDQSKIEQGSPTDLSEKITPDRKSIIDDAVEHMGEDEVVDKVDSDAVEGIDERFKGNVGAKTNKLNSQTERQDGLSI